MGMYSQYFSVLFGDEACLSAGCTGGYRNERRNVGLMTGTVGGRDVFLVFCGMSAAGSGILWDKILSILSFGL